MIVKRFGCTTVHNVAHADQREVDGMQCQSKVNPKLTHCSDNNFFPDKINIMQYLYLMNGDFFIFQACLLHWGHHMHVRV